MVLMKKKKSFIVKNHFEMETLNTQKRKIEMELNKIGPLVQLERVTHVPVLYLALSVLVLSIGLVFANFSAPLIVNLVGFVYPAYISLHNIEFNQNPDNEQWYTYWVIFGFLNMLDFFSRQLIRWFQIFYVIKLFVLMFLMHPQYQGAKLVYRYFIAPHQMVSRIPGAASSSGVPVPPPSNISPLLYDSTGPSMMTKKSDKIGGMDDRPASSRQTVIEPLDPTKGVKKTEWKEISES